MAASEPMKQDLLILEFKFCNYLYDATRVHGTIFKVAVITTLLAPVITALIATFISVPTIIAAIVKVVSPTEVIESISSIPTTFLSVSRPLMRPGTENKGNIECASSQAQTQCKYIKLL